MRKISKNDKNRITVIGADVRMKAAAEALSEYGFEVALYDGRDADLFRKYVHRADAAIVLGLPAVRDEKYIAGLGSDAAVSYKALFENMGRERPVLFGGGLNENVQDLAGKYGVRCVDYLTNESFALRNARNTAEGAIEIMMRELPVTVAESCVCIIGFGRIGRELCRCLKALGADVTVCARRTVSRAEAENMGADTCDISRGLSGMPWCDVIFNTVPHILLGEAELETIDRGTLLCELASVPGGIDAEAAKKTGHRLTVARGLPGKSSPVTAGRDIFRSVTEYLNEEERRL